MFVLIRTDLKSNTNSVINWAHYFTHFSNLVSIYIPNKESHVNFLFLRFYKPKNLFNIFVALSEKIYEINAFKKQ
jgi:hypothetical protein